MDTKQIIINFIDILLRVPSLFILDEVFQSSLADLGLYPCSLLPLHKEADFDDVVGDSNHTLSRPLHSVANYDIGVFGNLSQSLIKVIEFDGSSLSLFNIDIAVCQGLLGSILQLALLLSATCAALFTLTLWTKHLVKIYEFLFSLLLVTASYHFNQQASISLATATIVPLRSLWRLELEVVFRAIPGLFFIILNIATQSVLASGYLVVNFGPSIPVLQGLLALCFLVPSLTVMIPMERNTFPLWCFMLLSLHIALVVWINFSLVYKEVKERISYVVSFIRTEGFMAFAEAEWLRLNIPLIFRTFWMIRFGMHLYIYLASTEFGDWADGDNLKTLFKVMLIRGCETLPAILGMSSIFSWFAGKFYVMCQLFLMIPHDEVSHVGPVSAVLFIILAFQNGLSTLQPAARLVRLGRNIVLLLACFLHFVHNAVDPVLMSLAASANPDMTRHARALAVSSILTIVAFCGLYFLWTTHSISTWLLAVSGFSLEVICKVFASLALYGLFLIDAKLSEFWDKLDDHVYCVRFAGRVLEFLVGLFLLCNSAFILIYENGGAIRAVLVGLHAYFNLWCEARVGWKIFTRRRTAVHKISTLETVNELDKLDDVCAICFHDLKPSGPNNVTVKVVVTPCRHYFHAVCLRKWLYVQDRCPMCHQTLWSQLNSSVDEAAGPRYEDQLQEHLHLD
ncbi:protein TRC8 homolog [Daphnia pulicaria]|uniref:protein TRC8 homolog n=1 Tax=Daphnia pulicaria TaxID=35523 RepID=UPI001EEADFAD|nr:protein TRC8 homolog [Daphnia pulicaria]